MKKDTITHRVEEARDLRRAPDAKRAAEQDCDAGEITPAQKARIDKAADETLSRQERWDK